MKSFSSFAEQWTQWELTEEIPERLVVSRSMERWWLMSENPKAPFKGTGGRANELLVPFYSTPAFHSEGRKQFQSLIFVRLDLSLQIIQGCECLFRAQKKVQLHVKFDASPPLLGIRFHQ